MSIVQEYVYVKNCSNTTKYYENLGYEIPKKISDRGLVVADYSKPILVKVGDLPISSHYNILVKCDNLGCDCVHEIAYKSYLDNKHKHGGYYYCHKCSAQIYNSGENNYLYDSSKTEEERIKGRNYPEYREFVKRVLARDNYTCQCCGRTSAEVRIGPHHLNGYNCCKEGRCDDENGISLCDNCHNNFHSIYGRGNNTKEQFLEWLGITELNLKKYNGELPKTRKIYSYEEDKIYDSAQEFAEAHNIKSPIHIYRTCNHIESRTVSKMHIFWYDEYVKMSEDEIMLYVNNKAKIITKKQLRLMKEGK